ncbi:MATE family efflux transporter [Eubacterium pyruvativorans]|uniref:MATE family efflux transporter n=1 Tax=Eubacterium pyruvativorans TaxID=155865 RepID=UPI0023F2382E|nr:MATE family efflux transporter [Eubacterium pyruvativorans]MDD7685295.1 MATE family efflux transporter [Eubacterium pyruvativorans]
MEKADHRNGEKRRREMDMIHGSLWDKILLFALPLALTGMLQQLFNAADIAVLGRFAGKHAMAAAGSNNAFIALVVNLFVGLSLGANVLISRYTGRGDHEGVSRAVSTAVTVALLSGLCAAGIGLLATRPILELMQVPPALREMAGTYLRIYFLGMPFIMLYNFESAIFRSRGDTRTPLIVLASAGMVNVGLNLFFVLLCGMNVDGVAIATVLSNVLSSGIMFLMLSRSQGPVRIRIRSLGIHGGQLKQMMRIGIPAGVQGMLFSVANMVIQSGVNSLGPDVVAGSSAAFNVEIFVYFVVNAFGQAATTFIGQNHGAGDLKRCRRVTALCMIMAVGIGEILGILVYAGGPHLIGLFNSDPSVIRWGMIRMSFITIWEGAYAPIEALSGVMRGYGYSMVPALVSVLGICVLRVLWVLTVFSRHRTMNVLMTAFPISFVVTSGVLILLYFVLRRRMQETA